MILRLGRRGRAFKSRRSHFTYLYKELLYYSLNDEEELEYGHLNEIIYWL